MKIATIIARVLLGLIFLLSGLDGFFNFLPMPEPEGMAAEFMEILVESGWIFVIKVLEVAGGILLLVGRFVPLGLVLLGPVVANIVIFHLLLDPEGLLIGVVILILFLFLLYTYWKNFAPLFVAKA
jgi:putative oxidoreductase